MVIHWKIKLSENIISFMKQTCYKLMSSYFIRSRYVVRKRLRHSVVGYRLIESGRCTFPSKPTLVCGYRGRAVKFLHATYLVHRFSLMPTRSWLYSHRAEFPTKRENRVSFRVRRPLAKRGQRKSATKISAMTRYPSGLWRSSERRKRYVSRQRCTVTHLTSSIQIFACVSRHLSYYDSTLWCDDICRFLRIFRLLTLSSFTSLLRLILEIRDTSYSILSDQFALIYVIIILFNTHIQWKQKNLIARLLTILTRSFTCSNWLSQYWQTLKFSSVHIYSLCIGSLCYS